MPDPYDVLGVERDATQDEIRAAYYRLAREYHPDKLHGSGAHGLEKFKQVRAAYDTLKEPYTRLVYDALGEIPVGTQELNKDAVVSLCVCCGCCGCIGGFFALLAYLRLENFISVPWFFIFTPIWVIDLCFIVPVLFALTSVRRESWDEFVLGVEMFLLLLTSLLLYLRVAEYTDSATQVLLPLLAIDFFNAGTVFCEGDVSLSPLPGCWAAVDVAVKQLCRPVILLLCGLTLDGELNLDAWTVLSVLWLRLALQSAPAGGRPTHLSTTLHVCTAASVYLVLGWCIGEAVSGTVAFTLFVFFLFLRYFTRESPPQPAYRPSPFSRSSASTSEEIPLTYQHRKPPQRSTSSVPSATEDID